MSFYHSAKWRKKRREILVRDHYECQLCKLRGKYTRASVVHHIKHLDKFPELALININLVSLCSACHNTVHPEKNLKRRKKETRPAIWK